MQEMRIVPELPIYRELLDKLFFELMDSKLGTVEEMKAYLEPYSPPAPPPPVHLRRPRMAKKDAKPPKSRKKAVAAVEGEPTEGIAAAAAGEGKATTGKAAVPAKAPAPAKETAKKPAAPVKAPVPAKKAVAPAKGKVAAKAPAKKAAAKKDSGKGSGEKSPGEKGCPSQEGRNEEGSGKSREKSSHQESCPGEKTRKETSPRQEARKGRRQKETLKNLIDSTLAVQRKSASADAGKLETVTKLYARTQLIVGATSDDHPEVNDEMRVSH